MDETAFLVVADVYLSSIVQAVQRIRSIKQPMEMEAALEEIRKVDTEIWEVVELLEGGK